MLDTLWIVRAFLPVLHLLLVAMHKLNPTAEGIIPTEKFRAIGFDRAAALLQSVSLGLILPHIIFVNDLGHPLQTGLILGLFAAGRMAGKIAFRAGKPGISPAWAVLVQGGFLAFSYALIAVSAMVYPTGTTGLRLGQLSWFLIGLFGTNILFRRDDESRRNRFIDKPLIGISIGTLLSSALTWSFVRSGLRYDLTQMFAPACAAAILSAIAVFVGITRQFVATPSEFSRVAGISEEAQRATWNGSFVSACVAFAGASACSVTPMMLWESFQFRPGEVALMFGNVGFVIVCVQLIVGRMLRRFGGAMMVFLTAGVGLVVLGASSATIMWAPYTGSGPIVFSGIALLAIGWGIWPPAERLLVGVVNEWIVLAAWFIGPMVSASLFYDHERSSFALAGVFIGLAVVPLVMLRPRKNFHPGPPPEYQGRGEDN